MFQAGEAKVKAQRSEIAWGPGNYKQLSIVSSAKPCLWSQGRCDASFLKSLYATKTSVPSHLLLIFLIAFPPLSTLSDLLCGI